MATLAFDIETIGEDFSTYDETTQSSLTRWLKKESRSEEDFETGLADIKDGLGFSPLTGSIVAIGVYDCDKRKGCVYYCAPGSEGEEVEEDGVKLKAMTEGQMLEAFWEGAKQYDTFVSFNGRGFDVPFMMVRSAINGIRPSRDLLSNRYLSLQRDGKHVDLLDQLTFYGAVWRGKGNLHMWCRAFGIKSPKADGVSGDDVKALYDAGRYLDIARYNVGDIVATADLYEKWRDYLRF